MPAKKPAPAGYDFASQKIGLLPDWVLDPAWMPLTN